jgi:hypothetical protein
VLNRGNRKELGSKPTAIVGSQTMENNTVTSDGFIPGGIQGRHGLGQWFPILYKSFKGVRISGIEMRGIRWATRKYCICHGVGP